jgi:hypothetical protein
VVCRGLGVDSVAYTAGYIAAWGDGEDAITAIKASATRIQQTAKRILAQVEEHSSSHAAAIAA